MSAARKPIVIVPEMRQSMSPTQADAWDRLKQADAWRRENEKAQKYRVAAELKANSTEPTRRLLQRNVIATLEVAGTITADQAKAAREIERIWNAIGCALFARTADWDRMPRGANTDDWPVTLRNDYRGHYEPWSSDPAMNRRVRPDLTVFGLCIEIVVDGHAPNHAADHHHMGHERVEKLLRAALTRYCDIAGWKSATGSEKSFIRVAEIV